MSGAEDIVSRIGAERDGIVTAARAAKRGVDRQARARLRRRGVLVAVGRGVDRLRDHPFDFRSRCRAALDLAGDGAVLGLRTAARLREFYAFRAFDDVELLARRADDHRLEIGRLVQTRWLPPEHVTVIDGFAATTAARTFFDLCGDPDPGLRYRHPYHARKMKMVYNDALARRGMTFTQEAAVLLVLAKRGRRGTALAREILMEYGPKHRPTRSDTETLFFEFVRAYALPLPERQGVITSPHGFVGTVDFVWRRPRVIVEVDSRWHDGPLDEEADFDRDERLRAAGYAVKRYRYGDIIGDPGAIHRELVAAGIGNPIPPAPNS